MRLAFAKVGTTHTHTVGHGWIVSCLAGLGRDRCESSLSESGTHGLPYSMAVSANLHVAHKWCLFAWIALQQEEGGVYFL